MGIFTVFVLALSGAFPIYIYALLALCCGVSAVIRYRILTRNERRQKRCFIFILLALTLAAEITSFFSYNWVQYFALIILACCCAALLGVALAAVIYAINKSV